MLQRGCKITPVPIGTRYGKLTVIRDLGMITSLSGLTRSHKLEMKCDCGNTITVNLEALKHGTKDCGECIKRDIVGKRFGKLVIIDQGFMERGRTRFKCKCDCGNEVVVAWRELRVGDTKSCGECVKFDLVGQKVGHLKVLSYSHYDKPKNMSYYNVECDCGNTSIASREKLLNGKINKVCTCGECYHALPKSYIKDVYRKCIRLSSLWQGINQRCNNANAKEFYGYGGRGIRCEFTLHEFVKSYYLDDMFRVDDNLQVDRIDNNGNYKFGNIRTVTNQENSNNTLLQSDLSISQIAERLLSDKVFKTIINGKLNKNDFIKIKTNKVTKSHRVQLYLFIHKSLELHKHFYINRIKKFYEDCGGNITFIEE